MSATEIQKPVYELRCDHIGTNREGCDATFTADNDFDRRHASSTRNAAREAGWDVPPRRGKGARSPYDFCLKHTRR